MHGIKLVTLLCLIYVVNCWSVQLKNATVYNKGSKQLMMKKKNKLSENQQVGTTTRKNEPLQNASNMTATILKRNNSVVVKRECCHYYDHGHDLMEMHNNPHHYGSKIFKSLNCYPISPGRRPPKVREGWVE